MEPAHVVELGLLHQRPDLGALQMFQFILVRGRQMRAQASVAAVDENAASSRRLGVVDAVFDAETGGGAGRAELCGVVVLADAADVKDGGRGEDVLSAAGGVLCCAAGDQGMFAGEDIGVEGHVVLFGEDGVVRFEAILGEEGFVAVGCG